LVLYRIAFGTIVAPSSPSDRRGRDNSIAASWQRRGLCVLSSRGRDTDADRDRDEDYSRYRGQQKRSGHGALSAD
jgi:hypothetical protein